MTDVITRWGQIGPVLLVTGWALASLLAVWVLAVLDRGRPDEDDGGRAPVVRTGQGDAARNWYGD